MRSRVTRNHGQQGHPMRGRVREDPGLGGGLQASEEAEDALHRQPTVDQTAVLSPVSSAGYESLPTRPSSPMRREQRPQNGQPQEAERTVAMEYIQQEEGQPVVRWVARLTEFFTIVDEGERISG